MSNHQSPKMQPTYDGEIFLTNGKQRFYDRIIPTACENWLVCEMLSPPKRIIHRIPMTQVEMIVESHPLNESITEYDGRQHPQLPEEDDE